MCLAHVLLGEPDEVHADAISDPSRSGVEHDPDRACFVETELDEVVPGPESAEVLHVPSTVELRVLLDDALVARAQLLPCVL